MIDSFQIFTPAFIITKGGPLNSTNFFMLHLYKQAFSFFKMGYASALGFRASICSPYNAFDLVHNKELPVRIHPFAFMDSTLSDYMKVLPQDYIKFVRPLISSVRQVGGELIGIWHNYALSNEKDRHDAFKEIIKEAINDQACQV